MSKDNKTVLIDYDLHQELKEEAVVHQKRGLKIIIEEACKLYLEVKRNERNERKNNNIKPDGNIQ